MTRYEADTRSEHSRWIHRCLELAAQATGRTAPNPLVGAVVIKAGLVIGEGFHPGAGYPHAEVFALRQAGDQAQGATLYVNLEPCNHFGRTPPCTEAIIEAGIERVIVGMVDPDPRVSGSGIERLRGAGIEVIVGIEAEACEQLNEAFVHRILYHRPLGILKYAMTLDGKIATTTGHSSWVTGPAARATVHQLRAECDAVIVGGNTVRRDNPHLTTHGHSAHNPKRVVMSRQLDLPYEAHLWNTQDAPTLVFTKPEANPDRQHQLEQLGVQVIPLKPLTPKAVSTWLYNQGCACLLWECGGGLAAEALKEGLIDKIWAFIAPKLIGGHSAPTPVSDLGLEDMSKALPVERLTWRAIGNDLLIEGYLTAPSLVRSMPEDKF